MGVTGLEADDVSALFTGTYSISDALAGVKKRVVDAKTAILEMFSAMEADSRQVILEGMMEVV